MVTASHLGEEFNGFKVTRKGAVIIGGHELLRNRGELFDSKIKIGKKSGKILKKDLLTSYVSSAISYSGLSAGDITTLVKLIGNEMIINEVLVAMKKLSIPVVDRGEDVVFEFDADGDRLVVRNAKGEKIRGDLIGGLLAGYYFSNKKIAYDLRYSRGVLEYMQSKGIEVIPSRIGHTLIKQVMRKHEIEFCGEQSGHMFFKDLGYVEAPILAALKILNIMQETGKSIAELVVPVSSWSTTEEINFSFSDREKIIEVINKIRKHYDDADINETDGIRIEYPNWGFLLRPSNTEAKLRLIVDVKEEKILENKKQELLKLLNELEKD